MLLQESDKCFECNSLHPYHPEHHRNSHRIENVIYLMNPTETKKTWWQSVNGRCSSWSVYGNKTGRLLDRSTSPSVDLMIGRSFCRLITRVFWLWLVGNDVFPPLQD